MAPKSVRCSAVDPFRKACRETPKEGSEWCPRHNQERIKLYLGYKAHHAVLNTFPENTICTDGRAVRECKSYETVKGWGNALRRKYILLTRCIQSRAYFTERFFGNDMDFGHKTFWQSLKKQVNEIEELLENVECRAYELLLASQNALWVLDQKHDQAPEQCSAFDDEPFPELQGTPTDFVADQKYKPQNTKPATEKCGVFDDKPLSKPQEKVTPEATVALEDIEDPIDVAIREKRVELWEMIWTRLARYCAPTKSRYYKERLAVIWACVCRAVWTDPSLMLVAQNFRSAESLLNASNLDLPTVERLWNAIKDLYVDDVRAAIDDVLHPVRPTGEYVVVLGTRIHKELADVALPLHDWGHMTAVAPCYSCIRKACKTVDDIVTFTRYVILSCTFLPQPNLRYDFEYDGFPMLALCGFIPNDITDPGPRFIIEKDNAYGKFYKPRWTEIKTNPVICVGLSLTDPKSQEFLNACLRHQDLEVLFRKGRDGRVIRSMDFCAQRRRTAETRAALKDMPWDSVKLFVDEGVLGKALPIVTLGRRLDDCFQVGIIDDGDGDMHDFVDKLLQIWLDIYDVKDAPELFREIGIPYLENYEVEMDMGARKTCSDFVILSNTAPDVLISYKHLWGRAPREGQLVDDKMNTM
ncbi:hypothetical protein M413DRAFT_444562 [Hebeloma cylindrosporum]|uniref:Uncharacterized protein n=1 Tax=Hebeloma cylindrosporum TaxID=76867 RepID=A0A0C2XWU6_HEBCY|nr:hypothetical protein M413DRAFT_444562 [Hebeloma cylindrosporum h7]